MTSCPGLEISWTTSCCHQLSLTLLMIELTVLHKLICQEDWFSKQMLQSTNSLRNIAELEIHINKTHNICSALLSQLGQLFSPSHRNQIPGSSIKYLVFVWLCLVPDVLFTNYYKLSTGNLLQGFTHRIHWDETRFNSVENLYYLDNLQLCVSLPSRNLSPRQPDPGRLDYESNLIVFKANLLERLEAL